MLSPEVPFQEPLWMMNSAMFKSAELGAHLNWRWDCTASPSLIIPYKAIQTSGFAEKPEMFFFQPKCSFWGLQRACKGNYFTPLPNDALCSSVLWVGWSHNSMTEYLCVCAESHSSNPGIYRLGWKSDPPETLNNLYILLVSVDNTEVNQPIFWFSRRQPPIFIVKDCLLKTKWFPFCLPAMNCFLYGGTLFSLEMVSF